LIKPQLSLNDSLYHKEVVELLKIENSDMKIESEVAIGLYNVDIMIRKEGFPALGIEVGDPITKQFLADYPSPG